MSKHKKKDMKRNGWVEVDDRHAEMHRYRCFCECPGRALNLMGNKRIWTRIKFDCGEIIKINCQLLKKL